MKENKNKGLSVGMALLVTVIICTLAFALARIYTREESNILNDVTLLPCTSSQAVKPLENGAIYSDGTALHALNSKGRQEWSYVIGDNCDFSVATDSVAGWSADSLVVLSSKSGTALFSSVLNEPILSAVSGSSYTAALIGEEGSGTMVILDRNGGRIIDRITLSDITVLDYGFFNGGSMLWVMSLDTNGTVPMSQITTYKPGRMQSGKITDSEQIVYRVIFDSPNVYAVGTTYIRVYDYTGTENVSARQLVYGWSLIHSDDSMLVFVPMSEAEEGTVISDVRVISGSTDRTLRIPFPCFAITTRDSRVYGISDQYVMIHSASAARAATYQLPFVCDGFLGVNDDNCLLLTAGESVYMVNVT